ncbi:MAG: GAF domain-containing SpoIIE family protein phosphatase [Terriglobales bacterium]
MSSASLFPDLTPVPKPRRRRAHSEIVKSLLRLNEAAQKINSTLELDSLLDKVVTEVAAMFGCLEISIWLHDWEAEEMVLLGGRGCTVHKKGARLRLGTQGMIGHVGGTGTMRYAPDVRKDPYYIACEPEIMSEVDIPLVADGKVIGVFNAGHTQLDAFSPAQLQMLQSLADHIAVAIHNARLFQQERAEKDEARLIQQTLFPREAPLIRGFTLEGHCVTAGAVGGDWFDYVPLPVHRAGNDRLWGIVLADVSGKGMPAALLMSATRGMLRALVGSVASPAAVLNRLNRVLIEDFPRERFVTMIYAVLDPTNRTLTFASAGHPWPVFARNGAVQGLRTSAGLPLGIAESEYDEHTLELPPGSRVLLYSDGVTDAGECEGNEYGLDRLNQHLLRRDVSAAAILQEVSTFCGGGPLCDDATLVLLKAD